MKNKCNYDLISILSMCMFSYLRGRATKCLQCFVYIFILLAVMLLACATVHAKSYSKFSLIWNYQILYCFNIIHIADTA